jgi:hypothetical protein
VYMGSSCAVTGRVKLQYIQLTDRSVG